MPSEQRAHLDRVLGPVSATCIVIGAIIGVGIFFTPSRVVSLTGSGEMALLAWGIGGLIALLGALTFAELGAMYTHSGTQYAVMRDAYGPLGGFLFVFCNSTAIQTGGAAIIAIICAQNLSFALNGVAPAKNDLLTLQIATVMIAGLVTSNVVGVRYGSAVQNVPVFSKVATLVAIVAMALFLVPHPAASTEHLARPEGTTLSLLFAGLVPVLFTCGGWQHALWIGGEIRDPKKNVPRALIVGVVIVVVVYLSANWSYLRLLGEKGVAESTTLAADAVGRVVPQNAARIVAALVGFSAFGVLNAVLLSGPRLVYGMARDGRFFAPFAEVHKRFHTPHWSIVLIGGLGLVFLWLAKEDGVNLLLNGVVLVETAFLLMTGAAVLVLRRRRPDVERPVRVPLYPLVPVMFVLGESLVVLGAFLDEPTRKAAWIGLAWVVLAAGCYWAFFRGRGLNETGRSGEI